ncbi:MAG TPA: sulfotransferase [Catenuloplanes sp.]|jgi:hypothetical protein
MASDRPIFVVGCARSGTTMLQLMLHAHARIAIPPETRFVMDAYRQRRRFGDLRDADNRRRLAGWIVDRPQTRFTDLGLDAEDVTAQIVAAPPTLGSALGVVFRAYARRFDKPRWGDKRPAYLSNLDLILRLFPDAQIVNIVRDGRDCVASLKEMPWHHGDIYSSVSAWARAYDDGRRAARALDATSYYEVRYENLVRDPADELAALCRYLDEEYDPAMARPSQLAAVAVPAHKTWHARTRSEVTTERIGSWRERLTAAEIALCEAALGERLRACGYPLSGAPAPRAGERVRYRLVAARHRLAPVKRAAVGRFRHLTRGPAVAAQLTAAQQAATLTGPRRPPV